MQIEQKRWYCRVEDGGCGDWLGCILLVAGYRAFEVRLGLGSTHFGRYILVACPCGQQTEVEVDDVGQAGRRIVGKVLAGNS